jgi:hypothetical protein
LTPCAWEFDEQRSFVTLVQATKRRLRPGHLPARFTDAYEGYESAILDALCGAAATAMASGEGT